MSLVQGTNKQGKMCTEGSKVKTLRVVTLLRHAMIERENVIFCDPSNGVSCLMHAKAHGSIKVRLSGVTCKFEGLQGGVPDNHLLALNALTLKSSIEPFIKKCTISPFLFSLCSHVGGPMGGRCQPVIILPGG